MDKAKAILNNVEEKINSLNALFSVIDLINSKISLVTEKVAGALENLIQKFFKKKERELDEEAELEERINQLARGEDETSNAAANKVISEAVETMKELAKRFIENWKRATYKREKSRTDRSALDTLLQCCNEKIKRIFFARMVCSAITNWIVNTFLDNFFKVIFSKLYRCLISQ